MSTVKIMNWAGPRTWKTGAVKHGRVGYVLRNDFIVPPLYNAKRYDGVLPSTFKIFHEIKQAFGDDEQKYYELDSFVSARGIGIISPHNYKLSVLIIS